MPLKLRFTPMILGALLLAAPGLSAASTFQLSSPDFKDGGTLPEKYTCDGDSISPPLSWTPGPTGTQSYAVVMHHIPGPGDVHVYWVNYDIPATVTSVAAGEKSLGKWGINTVDGKASYTPPCSSGAGVKEYVFTVYALSASPTLTDPKVTRAALLAAIAGKTLATATLTVTYNRTTSGPQHAASGKSTAGTAGTPGTPPPADLLHLSDAILASELALTPAQVSAFADITKSERGKRAEELMTAQLTDAQKTRLAALLVFIDKLASLGVPPQGFEVLKLTADQRTKIASLTTGADLEGVLTETQKAALEDAKKNGPPAPGADRP